jgi:predicted methyltransferase
MRKFVLLATASLVLAVTAPSGVILAAPAPAYVAAAVSDASRPAADTARDADRKPADVLAFAGVKPGDTVGELIPGGGYYTRLLSKIVGPSGKVYALWPEGLAKARPQMLDAMKEIGPNVVNVLYTDTSLNAPEPLDLVWTSENYHDFHNAPPGGTAPDIADFNKAVFAALKPGGVFLVEDHAAAAGAGPGVTSTLHRIDPAQVKAEVEAAGFTLAGSSAALANPADPHTVGVFDPSIRGHSDKLLFKFKKAAK